MSFTLKKTCSRIFIITPIVQKNGDGHIQELCIYTALICNDIFLFTSRKNIP
uniref:Uncharacterized protein n=2 Tax=Klebsiella TaxID=570 RepID=A0A7G5F781_KLEPN|nr:hypothetical protein [Klebsiella pneumoniae]